MRIPRIYHPDPIIVDNNMSLTAEECKHLLTVLRLKEGHPIILFNGDGNEYSATLKIESKRQAKALIEAQLSISVESPLPIHLGQGISKGERMDFVLQKSVELGVTEITPLITERCPIKLNAERWEKKQQHWEKVIISACEQCGRNVVPKLHAPINLNEWLRQSTNQLRITLHPQAEKRMQDIRPDQHGFRLLIGPEGGLSDNEIYQSSETGFASVLIGPRVLRTETAALAAITVLQSHFGDL